MGTPPKKGWLERRRERAAEREREEEERHKLAREALRKYEDLWHGLETDQQRLRFLEGFRDTDSSDAVDVWAVENVANSWLRPILRAQYLRWVESGEIDRMIANGEIGPLALAGIQGDSRRHRNLEELIDELRRLVRHAPKEHPAASLVLEVSQKAEPIRLLECEKTEALVGIDPKSRAYQAITKLYDEKIAALVGDTPKRPADRVVERTAAALEEAAKHEAGDAAMLVYEQKRAAAVEGLDSKSEEYKRRWTRWTRLIEEEMRR